MKLSSTTTQERNNQFNYLLFAADFDSGSVPNTLSQSEEVIPNPIV